MGIFATGQTYEQLILHLLAHPLPEARSYGAMILQEVKAVMPSFVARVRAPRARAASGSATSSSGRAAGEHWARRLGLRGDAEAGPSVTLLRGEGDEDDLLTALLFESAACSEEAIAGRRQPRSTPTSGRAPGRPRRAIAPTAATGPAAASRRCATGSRSSPTTARSGTCSATGC